MPDTTPNFALPLLAPAQAQKHVTHNEALQILDATAQLCIESIDAATPPVSPIDGQVWALGSSPTGVWTGQAGKLALSGMGGWVFVAPQEGWQAWDRGGGVQRVFQAAQWQTIAFNGLEGVGIGTAFDTVNRLSVVSPATLLSHDGAGHQLKVNKAAPGDTASLLFQTNFSGRAELGLSGSDAFSVKVSANGTTWTDCLSASPTTGKVALPAGAEVASGSAAAPALGFLVDDNTGLFLSGPDEIGFAAGGVARARLSTTQLQLSVPITGLAVTQSPVDTTLGRMIKVGDFGIGLNDGTLEVVADLDAHLISGFFRWQAATLGRPTASDGVVLHQTRVSGSAHLQIGWGGNGREYHRRWSGGAWTSWQERYSQGSILGTVSEAAGVPTGAILERGTNANGDYMRWADGTQICTRLAPAIACQTAQGALFMNSTLQTWTFPAVFATGSVPTASGNGGGATRFMGASLPSNTTFTYRVLSATSDPTLLSPHLLAIGRWF